MALQDHGSPLPSILEIAERALVVRHLETSELMCISPGMGAADAANELGKRGFDVAPVDDERLTRYVVREALERSEGTVDALAEPIGAGELVTGDLSVVDGIAALGSKPFRFVLSGDRISGIVTWSDLQKPPVSMVVLALAIAAEPALDVLITRELPDWEEKLTEDARAKVESIYVDRCRTNTEVSRVQCMQIEHRLTLIGKSQVLRADLGFPNVKSWRRWEKSIKRLRNVLAHGGNVLEVEPVPEVAIALIGQVKEFAERAWALADGRDADVADRADGRDGRRQVAPSGNTELRLSRR